MRSYKKQDDQRKKRLEDQGQWKDLWEEANKTAQTKDQQIADLERQLAELRTSNETAAMKNAALAAINQGWCDQLQSNAAVGAEQPEKG